LPKVIEVASLIPIVAISPEEPELSAGIDPAYRKFSSSWDVCRVRLAHVPVDAGSIDLIVA